MFCVIVCRLAAKNGGDGIDIGIATKLKSASTAVLMTHHARCYESFMDRTDTNKCQCVTLASTPTGHKMP